MLQGNNPMERSSRTSAVCSTCLHYRQRAVPNPFADADLRTPEILKRKVEWDNELREIARTEEQRFNAGVAFDYEPQFYAWCYHFTRGRVQAGQVSINPVSGERTPIYALCAHMNPRGECQEIVPFPLFLFPREKGKPPLSSMKVDEGEAMVVTLFSSSENARAFGDRVSHLGPYERLETVDHAVALRGYLLIARQAGARYVVVDPKPGATELAGTTAIPVSDLIRAKLGSEA